MKKIMVIYKAYMDGEIKDIVGFVYGEEEAERKVKEYNKTIGVGDSFSYNFIEVSKLK